MYYNIYYICIITNYNKLYKTITNETISENFRTEINRALPRARQNYNRLQVFRQNLSCVMDATKPLYTLSVGEFREIIKKAIPMPTVKPTNYVNGYEGLANFLGCGRSKAYDIISSGIIDEAITRHKRMIIIDADKALELLKNQEENQ